MIDSADTKIERVCGKDDKSSALLFFLFRKERHIIPQLVCSNGQCTDTIRMYAQHSPKVANSSRT